ncbi:hypothetical protein JW916_12690 [Candidatus Sumerlaeota bacterium]|nr:hypothetical protein [Candidatus Sumerlaeota bacterium]
MKGAPAFAGGSVEVQDKLGAGTTPRTKYGVDMSVDTIGHACIGCAPDSAGAGATGSLVCISEGGDGGDGGTVYMAYGGMGANGGSNGGNGIVYIGYSDRPTDAHLYVYGTIHYKGALNDLSPYWNSNAEGSALEAALKVRGTANGDLDHSTLPMSLRSTVYEIADTVDVPGPSGQVKRLPRIRTYEADPALAKDQREAKLLQDHPELQTKDLTDAQVLEERNIGAYIGMNTAALQELHERWSSASERQDREIAALQAQNQVATDFIAFEVTRTVDVETPTGNKSRRLKEGVRFDENTGKLYRARTLQDAILNGASVEGE